MKRVVALGIHRGGLVALLTLLVYAWVASPHIVYGDNAEFSALGELGGVAHPSGYPLYVLWLRAWSWLPVDSPAHAAALATCVLTALQVLVLHAACRAWGARHGAATATVALFAAGPIVLRVQSEAEVFALNGLIAALVLWLSAARGPLVGRRRVIALGVVAGLGLANHVTCVLLAPIGLYGAVRGVREAGSPRVTTVASGLGGLALGLSPYLYLMAAPDSWASWGTIDDLSGLVRHFLREDYGGPGQFSPRGKEVETFANLWAFAASIGRAYVWAPLAIGLGAVGLFAARGDRAAGEGRLAWGLFAVCLVLAGPLLVMRFNVRPTGTGLYVVQRFHLLPIAMLAIPVAVGLDRALTRLAYRPPARLGNAPAVHAALAVIGFAIAVAPALPYVARMHSPAIERGLQNLLRTLPPNAIVIGALDEFHFGLAYLQGALGERLDVVPITVPQLGLAHYRERVRIRTGIVVEGVPKGSDEKLSVRVAEWALATGRPVFIDPLQANIARSFPTHPYGLVFRVLPRGTVPPPIEDVLELNKQLYARYRFGYALPGPDDQLATQFHMFYARAWTMLAEALHHAGRGEDAAFAREMAATLAPRGS